MAKIVTMIGTTHHPWYYAKTSKPEAELTEDARNLLGWSARVQESFRSTNPDVVVIVASDHFHQFFHNNMPQFLVGRMKTYQGTFYNETREFDLPRIELGGNRQLATDMIEAGFENGFDFAFSDEMRLDHACVVPTLISQPSFEIPVVPVLTNCGAPPIPTGQRFVDLGTALRNAIEGSNAVDRVAVVVSGNLSLEVGGPEQMMPYSVDPEFDSLAMDWLTGRDFESLTAESTYERLMTHGNTSFQFLNMLTMAALHEDMTLIHAEAMKRRGSPAPCFIYESEVAG
ncbi:MAG: extradiol ring-cleavage dioxygenase [Propionibacteriales bacterium]|nr:extradiol ring-cleavage dioxygenase [Propionibacteriales bacterium]